MNRCPLVSASEDFLKSDHKHRTHKAAERANELWCYRCSTMDVDKEYCMNVSRNDSSLHQKCDGDIRACMVTAEDSDPVRDVRVGNCTALSFR